MWIILKTNKLNALSLGNCVWCSLANRAMRCILLKFLQFLPYLNSYEIPKREECHTLCHIFFFILWLLFKPKLERIPVKYQASFVKQLQTPENFKMSNFFKDCSGFFWFWVFIWFFEVPHSNIACECSRGIFPWVSGCKGLLKVNLDPLKHW